MRALIFLLLLLGGLVVLAPLVVLAIRVAIAIRQAKQSSGKPAVCLACRKVDVRPSWQSGLIDRLLVSRGYLPYRCRACNFRFYRYRRDCATLEETQSDVQGIPSA
jgi:hypothetical protein